MPGQVENLWRIAKETPEFRADDLSGGGARATGGRWNRKGSAVVYTSASIALATLETLAHVTDVVWVRNAFLVKIIVPKSVWQRRLKTSANSLPPAWRAEPPGAASIHYGEDWLTSGASALLAVPSVIVPEEFNVLINPAHVDALSLRAEIARQYIYDVRFS